MVNAHVRVELTAELDRARAQAAAVHQRRVLLAATLAGCLQTVTSVSQHQPGAASDLRSLWSSQVGDGVDVANHIAVLMYGIAMPGLSHAACRSTGVFGVC